MKPISSLFWAYLKCPIKCFLQARGELEAEHTYTSEDANSAIKRFAKYRRDADGRFTERSLREYLVLASVFETCDLSNINVLKFLLSTESMEASDLAGPNVGALCNVRFRRANWKASPGDYRRLLADIAMKAGGI